MSKVSLSRRFVSLLFAGVFLFLSFQMSCGNPPSSEPTDAGQADQRSADARKEASTQETQPSEANPEEKAESTPEKKAPLDLSEPLQDGMARAGIIRTKEEIIGGPNSQEKIGDIKLYNSKVAFTVATNRVVNGYLNFGGKLVAADVVRPKGQPGQSLFQEFALGFQHRMMKPEKVEIVNDGSDGKAAVVRFYGTDKPLDLLLSYIKAFAASLATEAGPLQFEIINEYRLEPNSQRLEFRTIITNKGPRYKDVSFAEVAFFMGDGLTNYFPNKGDVNGRGALGYWDYHGFASSKVAYVVFPQIGEKFQSLVKFKTVLIGLQESFDIDPGKTLTRTWFIGVGRDLASAQSIYRRQTPKYKAGTVSGKVLDPDTKKPLAGAKVFIEQKNSEGGTVYVGQAISQEDGTYKAELPVGSYTLRVSRHQEFGASATINIKEKENLTQDLMTLSAGKLELQIEDSEGKPVPAKVSVVAIGQRGTSISSVHGRRSYAGNAAIITYPHSGKNTISLGPGKYKVTVTRGFFYTPYQQEVTVKTGESVAVKAVLNRVVDTQGYLSGDFHIHAHGSPDSQDTNRDKVSAMAAEGLELAVSTDHEFVTDFQPTIDAMGLDKKMRAIVGEEVTTHFGHFNPFPIPYRTSLTNNGAFQWYALLAPDMFKLIRKEAPNSVIQINHPRGSTAGGYFDYAGYNRETGKAERKPEEWSWNFQAIEVVNGNGFSRALTSTLLDWYSMLNRGYRITAMGNSDSHSIYTSEVGYPRNMVQVGHSDPQKLSNKDLSQAILQQNVVVSGGAMIQFKASNDGDASNAVGLGKLLSLTDTGKAFLHIKVSAEASVHLNKLQVIENGKVIQEKELKGSETTRFMEKVEVTPSRDSWYIVMVSGTKSLGAMAPGHRPFAFTNPIFVDVNKDKKFDAPIKP